MKLGLLTAPFPETPLDAVADWTAASGFTTIEIACWPASSGDTRRYAGTSHVDVDGISDAQAADVVDGMRARGLEISGLGYYPNPLAPRRRARPYGHRPPEEGDRRRRQDGSRRCEHLCRCGPLVVPGRELGEGNQGLAGDHRVRRGERREDRDRELPDDLLERRVAVAATTCAYNPKIWRRMFEEFGETIGLNFDPSHLIWLMIDIEQRDPRIR